MKSLVKFSFLMTFASLLIFSGCEEDPVPPTVETLPVTDVELDSAKSGGNVTDNGGEPVTARGVIWCTSEYPMIDMNEGITEDGEGTGEFTSEIIFLNPITTYYVRAYAVNSAGNGYGDPIEFTTPSPVDK